MQPLSHQAPGTPRLCCACLLWAPRSVAEQSLSSACHKLPEGFNESTVPTNLYRAKTCSVSHPCPSGTELPLVFTSQDDDVVNSRESKKPFLYFYLSEKNSKGKCNRLSGIFPFVPDYMINLAPSLKPIITYCLLNFTSAISLPLFNSIIGFYSKTSFSKEKTTTNGHLSPPQ